MKNLPKKLLLDLFTRMVKIRRVEETIVKYYGEQEMRCPTHLSIGQEAAAAGMCAALNNDDVIYTTHRCHAHYLAKGGGINEMIAELYGKKTGCCKGKGGSMHLVMPEVGANGASAIVGGSTPIALGSALAFQLQKKNNVAVAFGGDASVEGGTFHESLNFAALRKLPFIIFIENNFIATATLIDKRQPKGVEIWQRAQAYGIPWIKVDGTDVVDVYNAAAEAVSRARKGDGPTLIEAPCYRWKEHVGPGEDYQLGHRTKEELDEWKARGPLLTFRKKLIDAGAAGATELDGIETAMQEEIEEAFVLAKKAEFPKTSELLEDVYA